MTLATFRYEAARPTGAIVRGVLEAESPAAATARLVADQLLPIAVRPAPRAVPRRAVSRQELALVFQNLALLVAAGAPLSTAVRATAQHARGSLHAGLATAERELQAGRSLAHALGAMGGAVPETVLGMVEAGEMSGRLGDALAEVGGQLESEADLIARTRQALTYPILLTFVGFISVGVIGLVVVPRFAAILTDLEQQLPPATRLLLTSTALLQQAGPWLVAAIPPLAFLIYPFARRPAAREGWHRWLVSLPVVGPIRLALASARIGRSLGAMLSVGAPVLAALDAGRVASGDAALSARLQRARERVASGEPLAASLRAEGAILPLCAQLIAIGEDSGRLATMAAKAGELAAKEAQRRLRTAVDLLEPTLVIVFGALVAWVAAALLQALYAIRPGG